MIITSILGIIAIAIIISAAISVAASWMAIGGPIPKEKLDAFMEHHQNEYGRMNDDGDMFFGPISLPYISRSCSSLINRWYIGGGIGMIPRWSKWTKVLNKKREENMNKYEHPIDKYLSGA